MTEIKILKIIKWVSGRGLRKLKEFFEMRARGNNKTLARMELMKGMDRVNELRNEIDSYSRALAIKWNDHIADIMYKCIDELEKTQENIRKYGAM